MRRGRGSSRQKVPKAHSSKHQTTQRSSGKTRLIVNNLTCTICIKLNLKKVKRVYWTPLNSQLMSGPLRFSGTRSQSAWAISGSAIVASQ